MSLQKARDALGKAKIALMSKEETTFLTTVVLALETVWDAPGVNTAAVDGKRIFFSSKFVNTLTRDELLFLLVHEAMHVVFQHLTRLGTRNERKWNYAGDYVINGYLVETGFAMPAGGLYDAQFTNLSTEQVYDLIPDPPKDFEPDLRPPETEEKKQEIAEEVDNIILRAAAQAKMAGEGVGALPGDIQRRIEKLTKPRLNWIALLRRFVTSAIKSDYSFRRPNKRYLPQYYLPTAYTEAATEFAVAIDTSASVSKNQFDRFVSETYSILKQVQPKKVHLLQFDTRIVANDTLHNPESVKRVEFAGCGGTNIREVVEWANKHNPKVLVMFTDGYFVFPDIKPKCPVIWIIYNNPEFTPPYGKVVPYTFD